MKPMQHANTSWVVDALGLTLGQANHLPKGRLIYLTLRDWIRSGRLSAGQRLPSTRQMANELSLGRNTLMSSLDQLQSEGFLEARQGAGTFVCDLPFTRTLNTETNTQSPPPPTFSISARGQNTLAFCADLAIAPFPRSMVKPPLCELEDALPTLGHYQTLLIQRRETGPAVEALANYVRQVFIKA